MRKQVVHLLDNLGFSLSFLCAIHCVLFPLLIVALPLFGLSFLLDSFYEKMFLTFSLILASVSLVLGYLTHKSFKAIKIYFIASACLLIGMYGLGHTHNAPDTLIAHDSHASHEETHEAHEGHGHDAHESHAGDLHEAHGQAEHDHDSHAEKHDHSLLGAQNAHGGEGPYDLALILMILGGVALGISHFVNRKLCLSCPAHQHGGHCSH